MEIVIFFSEGNVVICRPTAFKKVRSIVFTHCKWTSVYDDMYLTIDTLLDTVQTKQNKTKHIYIIAYRLILGRIIFD